MIILQLFLLCVVYYTIIIFILWVITINVIFLQKNTFNNNKNLNYECGFITNTNIKISITFNTVLLCLLLVIYEIEFLILIPFIFNFFLNNFFVNIYIILIINIIILTLVLDNYYKITKWIY